MWGLLASYVSTSSQKCNYYRSQRRWRSKAIYQHQESTCQKCEICSFLDVAIFWSPIISFQVISTDAGQYACQAINALGTGPQTSSTEAKVRAPPRFEQKPRSYYQVEMKPLFNLRNRKLCGKVYSFRIFISVCCQFLLFSKQFIFLVFFSSLQNCIQWIFIDVRV